ncbi:DUF421 domain-containing protein [Cohnella abietis]|uniref:UPF0702 transmembrane protein YrbG n=1 Tax=Cohnella abietis TaxID=2507935 RepID=A0A3T1D369_9BACL|nr:DUF421 domain-containing protein [Cohnella abietis]BBI32562.1 UPF0702 transmembrane protein YrbG [Cohnella abietis]
MELTSILLRTLVMYFFVFLVMRFMGKREIGKLSVFDVVISIMIAEIAVIAIESTDKSILLSITPILLLVIIQIGMSFLSLKNRKLRILFDGKPSVLISNGHLNREEMKKQKYNLDDLMLQLRENQVTAIGDVELAVLESTGKLSVIVKDNSTSSDQTTAQTTSNSSSENNYSKTDSLPNIRYELLPIALILDGQVQDDNLEKLGKTRFWLKSELQNHNVDNFKTVFFCSIDHKGKLYIDKK